MRFRFDWLILLVGLGGTFGCGSGRVDPPPFVRQGVQLTIAPDPVTRVIGENQQFTCRAFFNDGTNGDATNLVRWSSSNPAVASIDVKTGLATAIAPGDVTIVAESATLISDPATMEVVFPSRLFVSNFGDSSVVVFDAAASGNAPPLRRIAGGDTLLLSPALSSFFLDEFFVASFGNAAVRVFTGASDGNIAPLRSIAGDLTGFNQPTGATVIGNEVFVVDQEDQSVKTFPRNASARSCWLWARAGAKSADSIIRVKMRFRLNGCLEECRSDLAQPRTSGLQLEPRQIF